MKNKKIRNLSYCLLLLMLVVSMLSMPAYATDVGSGNIAGVVTDVWNNASGQMKTICNQVVFPAMAVVCAVGFAISLIIAVVNFKKHHTIEIGWPIALLVGLLFALTASSWVWALAGM